MVCQLGCARCHAAAFPGIASSPPGPSLANIASRISRAWLLDWLKDHVLGAGAWLGGLLPLWPIIRVRNSEDRTIDVVLRRFSVVGMFAIAIILAGGLINLWARWNSLDVLVASAWGKVVLAKVLGFVVLVALAMMNRFVLMQRFAQAPSRARLTRNIVAEQAGGLAILAAAAVLGILPPPA